MKRFCYLKIISCLFLLNALMVEVNAQETLPDSVASEDFVVIPPLFDYIEAPEDLPDLQSRTNYLMDNFWNPFDFNHTAVDQNALNHAFEVYAGAMPYASEKKIEESLNKIIKKIKNNPGLSFQFTKAAEESLFGPRALIWYDKAYMKFLQNLIDNKKISEGKKGKYRQQLDLLKRTAIDAPLPDLSMINVNGTKTALPQASGLTLIEFVGPDCEDCRYSNLKLDISSTVNDLIEEGKLRVVVVLLDDEIRTNGLPEKWTLFASPDALKIMDLRLTPSFYVLKDNKIKGKNLSVDDAINLLSELQSEK